MTAARFQSRVLPALGLLTVVTTCIGVFRAWSPVPVSDQWDGTVGFYLRALDHPWRAFFEQHNEHRLVLSRLIFFADMRWFGGVNAFALCANFALAALLAATVYRLAVRDGAAPAQERAALLGATAICCFSWMQKDNFIWGFQSQWFAVYGSAALAFGALDAAQTHRRAGRRARADGWLGAALLFATAAAFSMANGMLAFAVLLLQAVYHRMSWRRVLAVGVCAAAVGFVYFRGWQAPDGASPAATLLARPVAAAGFVLLYLGSPAWGAHLGRPISLLCGALAALGLLLALHIAWRQRRQGIPLGVALPATALFVAAGALITAAGRLPSGLGAALASRYTTAALLGWLCTASFVWRHAPSPRLQARTFAVFATMLMIVASAQRFVLTSERDVMYQRQVAGLALREHVYDAAFTASVYPDAGRLKDIAERAEAAALSIFARGAPGYDEPPAHVVAMRPCAGGVDAPVPTGTAGVHAISGWICAADGGAIPTAVVLADDDGNTLGSAVVGARHGAGDRCRGWQGFAVDSRRQAVKAFGKIGPSAYCAIPAAGPRPAADF